MSDVPTLLTFLDVASSVTRRLDGSLSMIKGISFSEYQLLAALRDHPTQAATRVDLAGAVGLSPSGVTRALKPMEKLGIVETIRDQRDARKSLAQLTAAGVELVEDADGVIDDAVSTMHGYTNLSASSMEVFGKVLTAIADTRAPQSKPVRST